VCDDAVRGDAGDPVRGDPYVVTPVTPYVVTPYVVTPVTPYAVTPYAGAVVVLCGGRPGSRCEKAVAVRSRPESLTTAPVVPYSFHLHGR
jgi:hypothetical protein